jgi:hypothetical protein
VHSFRKASGKLGALVLIILPLLAASIVFLSHLPGVANAPEVSHNWLVFLAYGWTGMFLHEAGHALAGTLMGFRLSVFRVTPLEVVVQGDGRTRVAWHKRLGGGYLGLPKHDRNLSLRTILITVGGPAANVFTFLLCWLVLRMAGGMVTGAAFAFVRGLMIFSLLSAVLNLAPFEFGASKTDGRRLWDALWHYMGPEPTANRSASLEKPTPTQRVPV